MIRRLLSKKHIVVFMFLSVGVFLRFYNRTSAMYYMNDQAQLLLIGHKIANDGLRPLAGPPISLAFSAIPPVNYYFIAALQYFGSDPLSVAFWYIVFNIASCLLLSFLAWRRYGAGVGMWTLGLTMISMTLVENGRSIWEPHPTFWLVVVYLALTDIAFARRQPVVYILALVSYVLSIAAYPTPLLLAPYVLYRTICHMRGYGGFVSRYRFILAPFFLGVVSMLVFAPWFVSSWHLIPDTADSAVSLVSQAIPVVRMAQWAYGYASTAVHDLFRIWVILPGWMIGVFWVKVLVALFVILIVRTYKIHELREGARAFVSEGYVLVALGYAAPAIAGMPMMPHRLFAVYPFLFLSFARWVHAWTHDATVVRRAVAYTVVGVFIVGNIASWLQTTVISPRNDYPRIMRAVRYITEDMAAQNIPVGEIGVHYYRFDDQFDFFAATLYYPLHAQADFPVALEEWGNRIARDQPENHAVVYLACDGFTQDELVPGCIQQFVNRWSAYVPAARYTVNPTMEVAVFVRGEP